MISLIELLKLDKHFRGLPSQSWKDTSELPDCIDHFGKLTKTKVDPQAMAPSCGATRPRFMRNHGIEILSFADRLNTATQLSGLLVHDGIEASLNS